MKNDKIQIRISEAEKEELNDLAAKLDVPASQIIRDGVREKVAKLKAAELESAAETVAA